jgi:ribulose-5-phosphate 4-epimerase/fuculose-1-phosphate aldolase
MLNFLSKISLQSVAWINPQMKVDASYKDILFSSPLEKKINEAAFHCAQRGYAVDTLSEISARLSTDKFAINKRNATFRNLTKQDFQITALENALHSPPISACRHTHWHALVYQNTPAKFTLFCQPVHAMILANKGSYPQLSAYPDLQREISTVITTTDNEAEITMAIQNSQSILISGYGLLVWATEINELLSQVELLEFSSKIAIIGDQQGERECQN